MASFLTNLTSISQLPKAVDNDLLKNHQSSIYSLSRSAWRFPRTVIFNFFQYLSEAISWLRLHIGRGIAALWKASKIEKLLSWIVLMILAIFKWCLIAFAILWCLYGLAVVVPKLAQWISALTEINKDIKRRQEEEALLGTIEERHRAWQVEQERQAKAEEEARKVAEARKAEERQEKLRRNYWSWRREYEHSLANKKKKEDFPYPRLEEHCQVKGCPADKKPDACAHKMEEMLLPISQGRVCELAS